MVMAHASRYHAHACVLRLCMNRARSEKPRYSIQARGKFLYEKECQGALTLST